MHLRRVTGDDRYRTQIEFRQASLSARLMLAMYRPVVMLVQESIIFLFSLYLTVAYIIIFTSFTGYEFMYKDIYDFSQGETALCFLGLAIGLLCCAFLIPHNAKLHARDVSRAKTVDPHGKAPPESRLYWAMIGAPTLPTSMFWMAWTARSDISFWSPLSASVVTGFGMLCVFTTCYQYLIDTYEAYAASALSCLTLMRYLVSGAMIEVSIPFYKNLGVPHTLTILGCINAVLVPVPYVSYRYGPWIRKRSKYGKMFASGLLSPLGERRNLSQLDNTIFTHGHRTSSQGALPELSEYPVLEYDWCDLINLVKFWGVYGDSIGCSYIHPSKECINGDHQEGVMVHRESNTGDTVLLNMIHGLHVLTDEHELSKGRIWGPWLQYLNDGSLGDAYAKYDKEVESWPYSFPSSDIEPGYHQRISSVQGVITSSDGASVLLGDNQSNQLSAEHGANYYYHIISDGDRRFVFENVRRTTYAPLCLGKQ
ncbi:hypothetical protein ETB97_008636 [Aspergillus alliaceus]|uniref:Uncharacterized protein n=1 Tax=Petromyces alliaceus TaxID=209559 RepID=A0A8H6AG53_PETAA|nr:hypothetical protein ETB97_008636 [Aspergillus burnettii]